MVNMASPWLVVIMAVFSASMVTSHLTLDPDLDSIWQRFKTRLGKRYRDKDEETRRRHIWEEYAHIVQEHNLEADLGQHEFKLGLNDYSDWTRDEYSQYLTGYRSGDAVNEPVGSTPSTFTVSASQTAIPTQVDWTQKGYVTPVKNQGKCGSCWAFTATGALEAQMYNKTKVLTSLSEQNLVDCSAAQGNHGCDGGVTNSAFQYVRSNKGLEAEATYPYTGEVEQCSYKAANSVATCKSWVDIASGNEAALQQAIVTVGPVTAAIDASAISFQLYRKGVYSSPDCSSTLLDHAVLVVGYGVDNGEEFWLIKNSWGKRWGMNGYIRIARNQNNMCGVATRASYPVV